MTPSDSNNSGAVRASGGDPKDDTSNGILAAPRQALNQFLAAENWQERLKYCQEPQKVRPKVEAYYQKAPDGPVAVKAIDFQDTDKAPSGYNFYLFFISTENVPEGFPVSVEDSADGFKVDWEAFVEFNDLLLDKFLSDPNSPADFFHVMIKRKHFFGSDDDPRKSLDSYWVEPPIPGYGGYAFATPSTEIGRTLSEKLPWESVSFPILELEWAKPKGGEPYVKIKSVRQWSFRADSGSGSE
ncbi:MAG: hypothetical protein R3F11_04685 [Verrucomicrobiales bacterium]